MWLLKGSAAGREKTITGTCLRPLQPEGGPLKSPGREPLTLAQMDRRAEGWVER